MEVMGLSRIAKKLFPKTQPILEIPVVSVPLLQRFILFYSPTNQVRAPWLFSLHNHKKVNCETTNVGRNLLLWRRINLDYSIHLE